MDLTEIKKVAERYNPDDGIAVGPKGDQAWADRRQLAGAVPALLAEIERLTSENARLRKFEPAPEPQCGETCSVCSKCIGCGYCRCPGAPTHPDDKPAAYSLPADALAGVP